jgi:hypothetical protein
MSPDIALQCDARSRDATCPASRASQQTARAAQHRTGVLRHFADPVGIGED